MFDICWESEAKCIRALAEAGYLVLAAVKSLHIQFFRPKNCYKLLQNSVKLSPDICTWATTNIGKHFKESFSSIDAIHCHCSAIAIQYNAVPFGFSQNPEYRLAYQYRIGLYFCRCVLHFSNTVFHFLFSHFCADMRGGWASTIF